MKKPAMTKTPRLPMRRVPRSIIALAAPSAPPPRCGIQRNLKGGELGWNLDGAVTERMLLRQVAMAELAIRECIRLEGLERTLRADLTAQLEASLAKVKSEKEAGK